MIRQGWEFAPNVDIVQLYEMGNMENFLGVVIFLTVGLLSIMEIEMRMKSSVVQIIIQKAQKY